MEPLLATLLSLAHTELLDYAPFAQQRAAPGSEANKASASPPGYGLKPPALLTPLTHLPAGKGYVCGDRSFANAIIIGGRSRLAATIPRCRSSTRLPVSGSFIIIMYAKYYNTPFAICRLSSRPGGDLSALLQRADRLLVLEDQLRRVMPAHLRQGWRLASYKHGILALHCDNAAVATRLRLQQAGVLTRLKNSSDFHALQQFSIKVRPRYFKAETKRTARPISADVRSQILETAASIGDQALRTALQRLASTATREKGD